LIGLYLYLIFFYVFFGSSESTKVKKSTFKIKKTFLSNLWIAVKEERVDLFLAQPFYMFAFTNFISLLFIVTSISLILIRKPLSGIVKILDGKDRIQSILVIIGVIVFILGNFLQFIATFG
jgi:hypothetical protein